MAGQLIAGTIVDANGKPVDLTGQEGAKWQANVNATGGSAPVFRSSFNMSSLTDVANGEYDFSFIQSMQDSDWSSGGCAGVDPISYGSNLTIVQHHHTKTSSGFRMFNIGAQTTSVIFGLDSDHISFFGFGRLA